MTRKLIGFLASILLCVSSNAAVVQSKGDFVDKFRQLEEVLPTPNDYRNAAGEPGKEYWQQQVDYKIDVTLDEQKRHISASQTVTYINNSPYRLKYLWIQLEQNRFAADSMAERSATFGDSSRRGFRTELPDGDKPAKISMAELRRNQFYDDVEIGYTLSDIVDGEGGPLKYVISGAQMRIDLPEALNSGESFVFSMKYAYNLLEENAVVARSGYELIILLHLPAHSRMLKMYLLRLNVNA